jgi:hypothetical protein
LRRTTDDYGQFGTRYPGQRNLPPTIDDLSGSAGTILIPCGPRRWWFSGQPKARLSVVASPIYPSSTNFLGGSIRPKLSFGLTRYFSVPPYPTRSPAYCPTPLQNATGIWNSSMRHSWLRVEKALWGTWAEAASRGGLAPVGEFRYFVGNDRMA